MWGARFGGRPSHQAGFRVTGLPSNRVPQFFWIEIWRRAHPPDPWVQFRVVRVRLLRLVDRRRLAAHHDVEQLPDQAKRVDLIVMLAGREALELRAEGWIPARTSWNVKAVQRHAPASLRLVRPGVVGAAVRVGTGPQASWLFF